LQENAAAQACKSQPLHVFDYLTIGQIPMITKCIAFLAATLMLTNCCASGSGCAPTRTVAWDRLATAPRDNTQPPEPKKPARAKLEIIVGPVDAAPGDQNNKVQPTDQWEKQQAADQDDEAGLKRKLVICRSCGAGETARDDEAGANR
jgi:hypothetical protein